MDTIRNKTKLLHAARGALGHVEPRTLARIALVAVGAIWSWFRVWEPIAGSPIFRAALADILERRMTMELSMTIALVAALVIREFFTASLIAFFVLIAEVLEGLTVDRGRRAIADLVDLLPRDVFLRRGTEVTTRQSGDVQIGAVVVIKPGARIPV